MHARWCATRHSVLAATPCVVTVVSPVVAAPQGTPLARNGGELQHSAAHGVHVSHWMKILKGFG